MSSILDLITGGGLLPHVYCRKVTLENAPGDGADAGANVILSLELYQDKNALSNSTWLNNLNIGGTNFLDAMFMQILPFTSHENVMKLHPSYGGTHGRPGYALKRYLHPGGRDKAVTANDPGGWPPFPGNVYIAKNVFGDNYLPRRALKQGAGKGSFLMGTIAPVFDLDEDAEAHSQAGLEVRDIPTPFQISNSSMLGSLTRSDIVDELEEGRAREEIVDGKPYYVLPFEYVHNVRDVLSLNDLGFAFYTFLHVPWWAEQSGLDPGTIGDFYEKYIVEGPINTEVVFINGKVQDTREAFFLPDGRIWEGSAHLHATDLNEAPDGYAGDGGLSTDNSPYRGWMAGDVHISGATKLRLIKTPNKKISDFRHGLFPEPEPTALAVAGVQVRGEKTETSALTKGIDSMELFLSAFQKEKRKDFIRDSDSEYSKLYMCRDRDNNARGMFFIDTLELLRNNSNLFSKFFGLENAALAQRPDKTVQNLLRDKETEIADILEKSRILELKVYRDRVRKHVINTRYEKYANDKVYEEPSELIGTISDGGTWKGAVRADGAVTELTGLPDEFGQKRYFQFHDFDIGKKLIYYSGPDGPRGGHGKSAGLYQYRVVFKFKDGSYEHLYELHKRLSELKVELDSYYDLAVSSFSEGTVILNKNLPKLRWKADRRRGRSQRPTEKHSKTAFKKYYQNGSFVEKFKQVVEVKWADPKFKEALDKRRRYYGARGVAPARPITQPRPWEYGPELLMRVQKILGILPGRFHPTLIRNMIDPEAGSPKGIEFFSRLILTMTKKIASLLGTTKSNKPGSEFTGTGRSGGYTFNSQLSVVVSPSDHVIKEEHTFDHPNELFEATSNENIYVDYLSIGTPMAATQETYFDQETSQVQTRGFRGLRTITTSNFKNRCLLETAKFTNITPMENHFRGNSSKGNIGLRFPTDSAITPTSQPLKDSFSKTAFSYLTPSIVEISDPLENTYSYSFYYSSFRKDISDPPTIVDLLKPNSDHFEDWSNYDKLYMSLLNYSIGKNETADADLTDAYIDPSKEAMTMFTFQFGDVEAGTGVEMEIAAGTMKAAGFSQGLPLFMYEEAAKTARTEIVSADLAAREPYKRTFEKLGITFHDPDLHDKFFNQEQDVVSKNVKDKFPLRVDEYSDGDLSPINLFKSFLYHPGQSLIRMDLDDPRLHGWRVAQTAADNEPVESRRTFRSAQAFSELPNSLKMGYLYNNQRAHAPNGSVGWLRPTYMKVFEPFSRNEPWYVPTIAGEPLLDSSTYSSFFFFQVNLTAKIEFFRGTQIVNSKNDEHRWQILRENDLPPEGTDKKLFCRLALYDEKLKRNIRLPMLDTYFLIQGSAGETTAAPGPETGTGTTETGMDTGDTGVYQ